VVEFAAVVIAHARTRPDHHHKVNLLVNGLVTSPLTVGIHLRKRWSAWRWAADYPHGGSQNRKCVPCFEGELTASELSDSIMGLRLRGGARHGVTADMPRCIPPAPKERAGVYLMLAMLR
jgi:hypothetical protein